MLPSRQNEIEYIDASHTYLINGEIVPSVSQLLRRKFPNKYSDVPKRILDAKAAYGTTIHEAIERLENKKELPKLSIYQESAIKQYKRLKEKYDFHVVNQEQIIAYKSIYCGRYDMVLDNAKLFRCLGDIKTTAKLDKEYLSWQLSLYELGFEYTNETSKKPFSRFYCIWLPKGELGQFVEIERVPRPTLLKFVNEK